MNPCLRSTLTVVDCPSRLTTIRYERQRLRQHAVYKYNSVLWTVEWSSGQLSLGRQRMTKEMFACFSGQTDLAEKPKVCHVYRRTGHIKH